MSARDVLFVILSLAGVAAFFAGMNWLYGLRGDDGRRSDDLTLLDLDQHCQIGEGDWAQFNRETNILTTDKVRNPTVISSDLWVVGKQLYFRRAGKLYKGFCSTYGLVKFERIE